MSKDYYEVLDLPRDCTDKDIRKAYKKGAVQVCRLQFDISWQCHSWMPLVDCNTLHSPIVPVPVPDVFSSSQTATMDKRSSKSLLKLIRCSLTRESVPSLIKMATKDLKAMQLQHMQAEDACMRREQHLRLYRWGHGFTEEAKADGC
eukprot:TRINITY_DN6474_c0_g1_i2.p1 TRINITY_DN6474_c0_g1~~TRINITY_DN6474_c0_g1_i2.p1  ORF type:complete len:147 (+),score=18.45 TRINITY_DN6474_c0_g1_i2:80-520(+)